LFFLPLVTAAQESKPYMLVLGVAQDGGYPHIGCAKKCCNTAWEDNSLKRHVVSLALVDPGSKKWWLFEATPDIKEQLHYFQSLTKGAYNYLPDGIFLTHAHMGHYTGLMQFGREAMGTKNIPVYALPKMRAFLETNGPWSQLVTLQNISLQPLEQDVPTWLADNISVTAYKVPHRDEYSETAGFKIIAGGRQYLFIPDINKWDLWDKHIVDEVRAVDVAFVDATFYDNTELPGRNMSEIPHPLVKETIQTFANTPKDTKAHIWFIHFNHTNPLLWDKAVQDSVLQGGFHIAREGDRL
jgi:pyrroloquinoline quinone biosynthesis protein B